MRKVDSFAVYFITLVRRKVRIEDILLHYLSWFNTVTKMEYSIPLLSLLWVKVELRLFEAIFALVAASFAFLKNHMFNKTYIYINSINTGISIPTPLNFNFETFVYRPRLSLISSKSNFDFLCEMVFRISIAAFL